MATSQRRSALVASVAKALSFAIDDPAGHKSWALSQKPDSPCKRLRGAVESQRSATVFDSSAIPPIGIDKYLLRLSATFKCSDASFIAALILVDRLLEFDGGRLPLTERNVHRIFLASLVVAVKYHEDLVYSNSHYAKGGGVHLKEVNRLERVLLTALDFDLHIFPEQYCEYEASLLALHDLSHEKDRVNIDKGVPSKSLVIEGAVVQTTSATAIPSKEVPAAAPPVNPPLLSNGASDEAVAMKAGYNVPLFAQAAAPAYADAAIRRKVAACAMQPARTTVVGITGSEGMPFCPKSKPEAPSCAPWVPLDREILNLLAVPASR